MDNKTLTAVKQSLIAEMEQRVQDKILEPTNAELLTKLITNADDDNEATMIAELGTTYKRTGFHFDKRMEKQTSDIKYFKKNDRLSFVTSPSKPTHKLIIGDNYEALQNLLIEYNRKVGVIYIDPPYGKDSMGDFAKTNYENSITRDNLLSMLYPRLVLAKELLCDNGVIFCSIDDKNQAYVKCLFDEIFGERNFVGNMTLLSNPRGSQNSNYLSYVHESIIMYAKKISQLETIGVDKDEESLSEFKEIDKKGRRYRLLGLRKRGGDWKKEDRPKMFYPIYVDPNNGECFLEKHQDSYIEVFPQRPTGEFSRWTWSKEKFIKERHLLIGKPINRKGSEQSWDIFRKDFSDNEQGVEKKTKLKTIWTEKDTNYQNARNEMKAIFGDSEIFSFPKPTYIIKRLVSIINLHNNNIILDFFAGSGTTGHAVLDLNKIDGGNRQFILCQLNEKTDTTPNGIAFDVTSKRLKRIMTGECYDGSKDFKWLEDNEPYGDNLDVYDIASVKNNNSSEGKTPFDVIDEKLYGKKEFSTLKEKVDWICSNFAHTQQSIESDKEWQERIKKM